MSTSVESPVSYASPAEGTSYFSQTGNGAWALLSSDQKSFFLARATRLIDLSYLWNGEKASSSQLLEWPRKHVTDPNGNELSSSVIPDFLKEAVIEEALYLSSGKNSFSAAHLFEKVSLNGMSMELSSRIASLIAPSAAEKLAFYGRIVSGNGERGKSSFLMRG